MADAAAACAKVAELFPDAKVVFSAAPEVPATRHGWWIDNNSHELFDVDVGVVRSPFGVAETEGV